MADVQEMQSTVSPGELTPQQWDSKFYKKYLRENRFYKYKGKGDNSVIKVVSAYGKTVGDRITIPLVNPLSGAVRTGNQSLRGSEMTLDQRSMTLDCDFYRQAVAIEELDEHRNVVDVRKATESELLRYFKVLLRNDEIDAFSSISPSNGSARARLNGVLYANATSTELNDYQTNNDDRLMFGKSETNLVAGDHAASIANVTANDKADKDLIQDLRMMARTNTTTRGLVTPIINARDEENYVAFVGARSFRNIKDSLGTELSTAMLRGQKNPLWNGVNALEYDGVMVVEIPELDDRAKIATGTNGAQVDIVPVYLCGACAISEVEVMALKHIKQEDDYGFINGFGYKGIRGVGKTFFGTGSSNLDNQTQFGMVTAYVAQ